VRLAKGERAKQKNFVSPSFFPSFALGKRGLLFKGERI
jgi:hypothetical protein